MACRDAPTEPKKLDRREVIGRQEQYGELVRDLLTENPERVILKLLNNTNTCHTERAALQAHHASVRLRAIELLQPASVCVLEQIAGRESHNALGVAAKTRVEKLSGTW